MLPLGFALLWFKVSDTRLTAEPLFQPLIPFFAHNSKAFSILIGCYMGKTLKSFTIFISVKQQTKRL
jgi:hypothetical protein